MNYSTYGDYYCTNMCYYESVVSTDSQSLTAILALDFVGLGLDLASYSNFANMLYKTPNNEFNCAIQTPENNEGIF